MESELYKNIFGKGEARGEAKTILKVLSRRLGTLDPALTQQIQGMS